MNQREQWILWLNRARQQPSWATKIALTCAVLVIVVPLIALAIAALVVGVVVFLVLGAVATVIGVVRGWMVGLPNLSDMAPSVEEQGRENVRVIRR